MVMDNVWARSAPEYKAIALSDLEPNDVFHENFCSQKTFNKWTSDNKEKPEVTPDFYVPVAFIDAMTSIESVNARQNALDWIRGGVSVIPEALDNVLSKCNGIAEKEPLAKTYSSEELQQLLSDVLVDHLKERNAKLTAFSQAGQLDSDTRFYQLPNMGLNSDTIQPFIEQYAAEFLNKNDAEIKASVRENIEILYIFDNLGSLAAHRYHLDRNNISAMSEDNREKIDATLSHYKGDIDAFADVVVQGVKQNDRRFFLQKTVGAVGVAALTALSYDYVVWNGENRKRLFDALGSGNKESDSSIVSSARVSPDDVERDGVSLEPLNERK